MPNAAENSNDLGWLKALIRALADRPITRDQVAAELGSHPQPSPLDSRRVRVQPHLAHVARVEIYALSHVAIEVAVDIEFTPAGRPDRSAVEEAVGALVPMPRRPDDFSSGSTLAHHERGAHATARVFVELDADERRVVRIHLDADARRVR